MSQHILIGSEKSPRFHTWIEYCLHLSIFPSIDHNWELIKTHTEQSLLYYSRWNPTWPQRRHKHNEKRGEITIPPVSLVCIQDVGVSTSGSSKCYRYACPTCVSLQLLHYASLLVMDIIIIMCGSLVLPHFVPHPQNLVLSQACKVHWTLSVNHWCLIARKLRFWKLQ